MKRPAVLTVAAVAIASLLSGCAFSSGGGGSTGQQSSDGGKKGPVQITFQSLAYQPKTVAATKKIVDDWNAAHPDIQVKLRQGSWDNVHDQLVTQFQGGTAPDVIHDESADILGFASQGYLADLKPYLDKDVQSSVPQTLWQSVTTPDGKIIAEPTLVQTYVVFANKKAFSDAGVPLPTGDQLAWTDLVKDAKKLTKDGKYGVGWGLKQPTAAMMTMAPATGGTYFDVKSDGKASIHVGAGELTIPKAIKQMAYTDKSLAPVTLTQSGSDAQPGFFGGKYAMYIGGNFLAQQMVESAPKGFDWTVLPPLSGSAGSAQAAAPQTVSVSAQSKHVKESAEFVNYLTSPDNLAALGEGDWLIPASSTGRDKLSEATKGENGWPQMLTSAQNLQPAAFQKAVDYPQWKDQYATPALQQYFANKINDDQLTKQLTDGWASAGG